MKYPLAAQFVGFQGATVWIGDPRADDDPVVAAYPHLFTDTPPGEPAPPPAAAKAKKAKAATVEPEAPADAEADGEPAGG